MTAELSPDTSLTTPIAEILKVASKMHRTAVYATSLIELGQERRLTTDQSDTLVCYQNFIDKNLEFTTDFCAQIIDKNICVTALNEAIKFRSFGERLPELADSISGQLVDVSLPSIDSPSGSIRLERSSVLGLLPKEYEIPTFANLRQLISIEPLS